MKLGDIRMRIRVFIAIFSTAIAAVGCTSLHQNEALGGSDTETASLASRTEIGATTISQSGVPDYRQILADPGPF